MNEGDLVRFKDQYAGVWNPPMLLVGRGYEAGRDFMLALHPDGALRRVLLTQAWYYEVVNGEE